MEIDLKRLPRLWFENAAGERWIPPDDYQPGGEVPDGFCYQVSAFPLELTTTYLKLKPGGSEEVARGGSTCSNDLVTAMVREWREHNGVMRQWTADEAIRIVGNTCERCMNSLAHKFGLAWGYPEGGEEWEKAHTECVLCKPELVTYIETGSSKHGEVKSDRGDAGGTAGGVAGPATPETGDRPAAPDGGRDSADPVGEL